MNNLSKLLLTLAVCVVVVLGAHAVAPAQECGNFTNESLDSAPAGAVDHLDLSRLWHYLSLTGTFDQPPVDPDLIELDDRSGITASDALLLLRYLNNGGELTCGPAAGSYSFAQSLQDTIFVPATTNVPANADTVRLPVRVVLGPGADGVYLPVLPKVGASNDVFAFDHPRFVEERFCDGTVGRCTGFITSNSDTAFHFWVGDQATLSPVVLEFELFYNRVQAGDAQIYTALFDKSDLLVPAIIRNGDLLRPVIVSETGGFDPTFLAPVGLAGDTDCDGRVDVGDVTNYISHLFFSGPAAAPCGGVARPDNVNCDGSVDVGDLTEIIGYLFTGGPEPSGCGS